MWFNPTLPWGGGAHSTSLGNFEKDLHIWQDIGLILLKFGTEEYFGF